VKPILRRKKVYLARKDIENLSCFYYIDSNSLLATAFSNFPLPLKRHCVQVGTVAGLMAKYVPSSAIPENMTLDAYANAVRYGSLYHDMGAYLAFNQRKMYPSAGERFLRKEIDTRDVSPAALKIMLETVRYCGERYDGSGYPDKLAGEDIPLHAEICAIANTIDECMSVWRGMVVPAAAETKLNIVHGRGIDFSPEAVECFTAAYADINLMYKRWRKVPPFWKNSDIKPLDRSIEQVIG